MKEKHLKMESIDMTEENIKKIAALFPNCVTEAKDENGRLRHVVNFELLKQMLSPEVVDGAEHYEFTWVGKKAAIVEANKPIRKTLRSCPEESKNWDTTENLYIEGDNLEVLKLLQENYLGKVKMIYIDPPYNTGNDFVYRDNFVRSQEEENAQMGLFDEDDNHLFKNTDTNGRFHSDWCSMIYSRLMLARNLLADDGVIFISIDDNEVENLKKCCDEVFGENNALCIFPRVTKKGGKSSNDVAKNHDYIIAYTKNRIMADLCGVVHNDDGYSCKDTHFEERGYYKANQTLDYDSLGWVKSLDYPIVLEGETFYAGGSQIEYEKRQHGQHGRADWGWRWSRELFEFGLNNGFIEVHKGGDRPRIYTKTYQRVKIEKVNGKYQIVQIERTKPLSTLEFTENIYSNDNAKKAFEMVMSEGVFEYTKPLSLVMMIARLVADKGFIVLDFFSGSATTAHAVMQLNAEDGGHRKFIMVQLPEKCDEKSEAFKAGYKNICEIGKERIRRAGEKIVAELESRRSTTDNTDAASPTQICTEGKENQCSSVSREAGIGVIGGESLPDIGFRVLKVADSNMKDVYYAAGDYTQDLLTQTESNIKEDRTDLDLLFGCLLDWGLPLSLPYRSENIDGCVVHTYNDGDLIACFAERIPVSVIKTIAKRKPLRAVFRDAGFASSPAKINVFEIFKLYAPDTSVKVI